MKRLLLNIMRCFLPILFVSYLACITCFAHVHVVNGVTVVHSHPFKKGVAHGHTTFEMQIIHFLSHWAADGASILFALAFFIPFFIRLLSVRLPQRHYHSPYHGVLALRAPPATRF